MNSTKPIINKKDILGRGFANAGRCLFGSSHWVIISADREDATPHENRISRGCLANDLAHDGWPFLYVRGQWDGSREISFLVFTKGLDFPVKHFLEVYKQDCCITPEGLVWQSGKVNPLLGVKTLRNPSDNYSEIEGDHFVFDFHDTGYYDRESDLNELFVNTFDRTVTEHLQQWKRGLLKPELVDRLNDLLKYYDAGKHLFTRWDRASLELNHEDPKGFAGKEVAS